MAGWIGHRISITVTDAIKTKIDLVAPCDVIGREVESDLANVVSKARGGVGGLVSDIASQSRLLQIETLSGFGSNKTGRLAGSISIESSGNSALVGTDLYYASYVEEGRGSITATGKALHFFLDGEEVFVKSVGPASPRPYVENSFSALESRAEETVNRFMDSLL